MTFERDTRMSPRQYPLWHMDVGDRQDRGGKRRLVIEPYSLARVGRVAELHVWVEKDVAQYYHIVGSIMDKPKGAPMFRVAPIKIEASDRTVPADTGLESVVIDALVNQEMVGTAATAAIHNMFWTHFVLNDDGLTWLCKYAAKDIGNFYARERLVTYTRAYADPDGDSCYEARHAIEEVMKHDDELAERMCQRLVEDKAFNDAIEVLLLTNEPEEIQHRNVLRMVELNVTDRDLVFASIVGATRDQALRGLRACQRAEHDTAFFDAVAAIARAEHTPSLRNKRINSFLYKSRKPS